MKPEEYWKNFALGDELSISGAFIYNGLRRFYEMKILNYEDEVFEVLYNLSVGLERILKICVVLLEHEAGGDQQALEESLITHNHLELLARVRQQVTVNLAGTHNDLLGLLSRFYNSLRYDRFTLASVSAVGKERDALNEFLAKHLKVSLEPSMPFGGIANSDRYRKFLRKSVIKVSSELYSIVRRRAHELNLYTYELRHGSKAQTVFLGKADIEGEEVLWKELLVFFMNTRAETGLLKFLREIEPLDFDPALANDYLGSFQSAAGIAEVIDELEHHYENLPDKGARLEMMKVIGDPNVFFDDDDEEDEEPFEPLVDDSGLPDPFDPEPSK